MQQICQIGGAETWLYHLTTILKDHFSVQVIYEKADLEQLKRLPVQSISYFSRSSFDCDILINLFNGRPNKVRAKYVIQAIHSNYGELPWIKFEPYNRVNGYIFVSDAAKKYFTCDYNEQKSVVLTNPLCKQEIPEKTTHNDKLMLLAATRLTQEKGGERMIRMCKSLRKANIEYQLDIYTTWDRARFERETGLRVGGLNIFFHKPKLDLRQEMVNSDYVVQLSDSESFCYTVHEAASLKVPVLVTDWSGVRNIVIDGENGYIVDLDMKNFRPSQLLTTPPCRNEYDYSSNDQWVDYLNNLEISDKRLKSYTYFFK